MTTELRAASLAVVTLLVALATNARASSETVDVRTAPLDQAKKVYSCRVVAKTSVAEGALKSGIRIDASGSTKVDARDEAREAVGKEFTVELETNGTGIGRITTFRVRDVKRKIVDEWKSTDDGVVLKDLREVGSGLGGIQATKLLNAAPWSYLLDVKTGLMFHVEAEVFYGQVTVYACH